MKITNIDTIMARSLRSLAGFCIGEYGKKELEIILLQLLSSIKKIPTLPHRSIAVFKVFALSQEIRDIICICSICYISCIWEFSSIYNITIMIFTNITVLLLFCKLMKIFVSEPEKITLKF